MNYGTTYSVADLEPAAPGCSAPTASAASPMSRPPSILRSSSTPAECGLDTCGSTSAERPADADEVQPQN